MKKTIIVTLILVVVLTMMVSVASAYGATHGTIRGAVYQDMNGDGKCVNTGVAGEGPVAGISLEFVNSDGKYVIHLSSGDNGTFGLADAGFSNWKVTAQPNSDWVVTSTNPQYAFIDANQAEALNVNFCVAKVGYWNPVPGFPSQPIYPGGQLPPSVVLPESGASVATHLTSLITAVIALLGISLILVGAGIEVKRRRF